MRFIHNNLWGLASSLILVAALLFWFFIPDPPEPKKITLPVEPWQITQTIATDTKKLVAAVELHNLWGAKASETPLEPELHVRGMAQRGSEHYVMISVGNKPMEIVKVGDTLPNGSKIIKIEENRFLVMTPDKKKLAFGITK